MPEPLSEPLFGAVHPHLQLLDERRSELSLDELRILQHAVGELIKVRRVEVAQKMRGRGCTWTEVGRGLGISGQAAWSQFSGLETRTGTGHGGAPRESPDHWRTLLRGSDSDTVGAPLPRPGGVPGPAALIPPGHVSVGHHAQPDAAAGHHQGEAGGEPGLDDREAEHPSAED